MHRRTTTSVSLFMEKDMLEYAMTELSQAIELNPEHSKAHYNLGLAQRHLGNLDAAISEWEKAVKIDPNYIKAHNNLGVAYDYKGKIEEAIYEYKRTTELDPDYAEAITISGLHTQKRGIWMDAISSLRKPLILIPQIQTHTLRLELSIAPDGKIKEADREFSVYKS